MRKIFYGLAIVFGILLTGFSLISPAESLACYGIGEIWDYSRWVIFSGNVTSIYFERYSPPQEFPWGEVAGTYSVHGAEHTIFEVKHMFRNELGETVDLISYVTTEEEPVNSRYELGKEYLVFGYAYRNSIENDHCAGTRALEIVDSIKNSQEYYNQISFGELLTLMLEDNDFDSWDVDGIKQILNTLESEFIESPKQQMKTGILPSEVQCKEGLELIFKNDDSPACVKPTTAERLIQRGWANP